MNKFIVNDLILDTSMGKSYIEGATQFLLNLKYEAGTVGFTYNEINPKEIELIFKRKTRYEVNSDVLTDDDCILLTGLDKSDFQVDLLGKTTPLVRSFPYGSHFYVGIPELIKLYNRLTQGIEGRKIKTRISVNDSELKVNIKFK